MKAKMVPKTAPIIFIRVLKFGITVTTRPDIVTRLNRMRRGNTRVVGILEGDDVIGRSFCDAYFL